MPLEAGVDVIAVRALAFKRFLEITALLDLQTDVITDNDGDIEALKKKYDGYFDKQRIKIRYDDDVNCETLEPQLLKANGRAAINSILGKNFQTDAELLAHMERTKRRPHCASLRLICPGPYLPISRRRLANEIIIAAAGGGKTTRMAARARAHELGGVAVVTYTTNNVQEIKNKFFELHPALPAHAEIWSWYRFLLHEMARPYQRALLDRRIDGLHWVEGRSAPYVPRTKTTPFFLSQNSQIYSDKIARFIIECNTKSSGAVIARLEDRFHTIFIDEIQDMAGYDLDLLELILRSKIDLVMVGDHRQATYRTNNAAKNGAYAGANIIAKFREWERTGLITLSHARETYRCHQLIAVLADSFYPAEPKTISKNEVVTGHDGAFLVSAESVSAYMEKYRPQVLRLDRRTGCDDYAAMNFGEFKGMTFDRVLIFPHGKGRKWLASGEYDHVKDSAAKMYVGVTRARHSVAFVFNDQSQVSSLVRYS